MTSRAPRRLELLAPAGNAEIAVAAINHGADAIYIGAPSHGARHSAANSIDDIERVVGHAHTFNARVYVTVNTIVYERELRDVEKMIRKLYRAGVDALIVQDMGILRLDIPPIALHASTQCDIRTPEKARFLQEVGFSQLVLARELSVAEIGEICRSVEVPVEVFVHGALCTGYSGRCSAGFAIAGRSGNRGECPQICRQSFTLRDADGRILAKDKYLLSLKDFRAESQFENLVAAGVSSFKIEGRLKEIGYVKNVTAFYSRRLDGIVEASEGRYCRSSFGTVETTFTPDLHKSFNRGFTTYRLEDDVKNRGIASIDTPKSQGEKIIDPLQLAPGDGISYFDKRGEYTGVMVNGVGPDGRIKINRPFPLPKDVEIRRTSSVEWKRLMARETATRKLALDVRMNRGGVTANDESGAMVRLPYGMAAEQAQKPTDYGSVFSKLGNTPFQLREFVNDIPDAFFPVSSLAALRRELIDKLLAAKRMTYLYDYRRKENQDFPYPARELDYRDNVANSKAEQFYRDHGIQKIEPALETGKSNPHIIMSSKHCILRELGLCKRHTKIKEPLTLHSGALTLHPTFDCLRCEMHLHL